MTLLSPVPVEPGSDFALPGASAISPISVCSCRAGQQLALETAGGDRGCTASALWATFVFNIGVNGADDYCMESIRGVIVPLGANGKRVTTATSKAMCPLLRSRE
jgi:hypothetical protein